MSFVNDINGAMIYTVNNAGPAGVLGPRVEIVVPIGRYQVFTDGLVFYQIGKPEVDPNTAGVWTPDREFVFGTNIATQIVFALASIGTARVIVYPEHVDRRNVEQIRGGVPPC